MQKRLFIFCITALNLFGYELGSGVKLSDALNVGGYVSLNYESSKDVKAISVDDIALMAYGTINTKTRYLVELENASPYVLDVKSNTDTFTDSFKIERMMMEHKFSSNFALSLGKMSTPVGYWSQTPINVLKDTTSDPLTATNVFPKLFSGVQAQGDIDEDGDFGYTVLAQHNKDIDPGYNNFKIDRLYAAGARASISDTQEAKLFVGYFRDIDFPVERRFVDAAYKYEFDKWQLISEAAFVKIYPNASVATSAVGAFGQARYKLTPKDFLIYRAEYYFDGYEHEKSYTSTIGYNYRPTYPVSVKAEYQLNSVSQKSRFLCSVSVLF